jgi:hypothetical protein
MSIQEQIEEPVVQERQLSDAELVRRQIVSGLLDLLGLSDWVTYSKVMSQIFFVVFLLGIGIFHVYNTHLAEDMVRRSNRLEMEIKELRWEYMSVKADLMKRSMYSDIKQTAESIGLISPPTPPAKIVVKRNEN